MRAVCNGYASGSDPRMLRAAAMVGLALAAGLRTQELQHAKRRFLDPELRYIFLDHVKGMGSYGHTRTVPFRPVLQEYVSSVSLPESIFPNPQGEPFSVNALTNHRNLIVRESGVKFDFRMTRRTYAQYLIDEGFMVEEVAVVLGYTSSRTTEQSYARPRDDRVMRKIIDRWEVE